MTLGRVKFPLKLTKIVKGLGQVGYEILLVASFDNYVVDVSFNVAPDLRSKAVLDCLLVSGSSVFEPKRHCGVAVGTVWGDECGLFLIFFLDHYLVVPRVVVKEAEESATRRGVDDLINPRQPEGVLGAMLVEIRVVNTHPPLIGVIVPDERRVSKPLRVKDFFDEARQFGGRDQRGIGTL